MWNGDWGLFFEKVLNVCNWLLSNLTLAGRRLLISFSWLFGVLGVMGAWLRGVLTNLMFKCVSATEWLKTKFLISFLALREWSSACSRWFKTLWVKLVFWTCFYIGRVYGISCRVLCYALFLGRRVFTRLMSKCNSATEWLKTKFLSLLALRESSKVYPRWFNIFRAKFVFWVYFVVELVCGVSRRILSYILSLVRSGVLIGRIKSVLSGMFVMLFSGVFLYIFIVLLGGLGHLTTALTFLSDSFVSDAIADCPFDFSALTTGGLFSGNGSGESVETVDFLYYVFDLFAPDLFTGVSDEIIICEGVGSNGGVAVGVNGHSCAVSSGVAAGAVAEQAMNTGHNGDVNRAEGGDQVVGADRSNGAEQVVVGHHNEGVGHVTHVEQVVDPYYDGDAYRTMCVDQAADAYYGGGVDRVGDADQAAGAYYGGGVDRVGDVDQAVNVGRDEGNNCAFNNNNFKLPLRQFSNPSDFSNLKWGDGENLNRGEGEKVEGACNERATTRRDLEPLSSQISANNRGSQNVLLDVLGEFTSRESAKFKSAEGSLINSSSGSYDSVNPSADNAGEVEGVYDISKLFSRDSSGEENVYNISKLFSRDSSGEENVYNISKLFSRDPSAEEGEVYNISGLFEEEEPAESGEAG